MAVVEAGCGLEKGWVEVELGWGAFMRKVIQSVAFIKITLIEKTLRDAIDFYILA